MKKLPSFKLKVDIFDGFMFKRIHPLSDAFDLRQVDSLAGHAVTAVVTHRNRDCKVSSLMLTFDCLSFCAFICA